MVGGAAFAPLWTASSSWPAGWWSASHRLAQVPLAVARPAGTPARLPALLVDDLVEVAPAARLRRPREAAGIGRIAEREQELAVVVGRVAEQLRVPDRGRRRSPARSRSRAPRRPASCSPPPGRGRTGSTAAHRTLAGPASPARHPRRRRRGGRPTDRASTARARCARSRQTMNAQRWRFLRAAGPSAGLQDPLEVRRGPAGCRRERADRALRSGWPARRRRRRGSLTVGRDGSGFRQRRRRGSRPARSADGSRPAGATWASVRMPPEVPRRSRRT